MGHRSRGAAARTAGCEQTGELEVAEVVTGEAVVLEVPCARFPSRLPAVAIDLVIQGALLVILFALAGASGGLNAASAAAAGVAIFAGVVVGYPVAFETLTRGRSPGKFALGLRVVSDDGGPERFRQALVRGLAAVAEIWMLAGAPALICSLLSARGKRLGDLFAGTFVIQQRLGSRRSAGPWPAVTPELARWAADLDLSGLREPTAETARRYLARVAELRPAAAAELGRWIAAEVSAQVGPPPPAGTPAPAYLSAVLAERAHRERARLAGWSRPPGPAPEFQPLPPPDSQAPPPGGPAPGAPPGPAPGAPPGPAPGAPPGPAPGAPPGPAPGAPPGPAPGAPPGPAGRPGLAPSIQPERKEDQERQREEPPAARGFVPPA
jgi:uncharacterized RDD family membrane protein YckC